MEDDRELSPDGKLMTFRLVMKVLGIGLLVLMAALAVFIWTFDLNDYRETLAERASRAIGAPVTFDGPINLDLAFQSRLSAERIRIANPQWASRRYLLEAERVEIEILVFPLFKGNVNLPRVQFTNLDLLLEEGPNGSKNWVFGAPSLKKGINDPKSSPPSDIPSIEVLTIQNSTIGYRTYASDSPFTVDISEATASLIPDKPVRLLTDGRIRGEPLSFEIITATLQEFVAPTGAWPIKVSLTHPGASLLAEGTISSKSDMVELAFDFSGDRLDTLNSLLEEDLPPLGPYRLRGRMTSSEKEWQLADLNLRMNQTVISGKAQASRIEPNKHFEVDLGADTLYVEDFLPKVPQPSGVVSKSEFGDVQIPVTFLKELEARIGIKIEEFRLNDQSIGSGSLLANAEDGLLHMELKRASGFLGKLRLDLKIDARGKESTIRFEGRGDSINYGRMLKTLEITDEIQGETAFEFLFNGTGNSFNNVLKGSTLSILAGPSVLIHTEPDTGSTRRIDLSVLRGSVFPGKAITFELGGKFRRKPLVVNLTAGPVRDFIDSENPWPIMISGRVVDASLLAKGSLRLAQGGLHASLKAGIKGDRMTSFDPELPPLGPYRVTAMIDSEKNQIVVSDLDARFAGTHLKGSLTIDHARSRTSIKGNVSSESLRFEDVLKPTPGPLPVEAFQGFDLNLGVGASKALVGPLELSDFFTNITLNNGLLTVSPIRGRILLSEGKFSTLQGRVELNFSHPSSTLTVKVKARSWPYGEFLQKLEFTDRIRGTGDVQLTLKGKGTTMGTLLKESSVKVQTQTKDLTVLIGDEDEERIDNVHITLLSEKGKNLKLKGKGAIQDTPLYVDLRSGALNLLFAKSGQWPLAGTADLGNLYLKVSGKLHLPLEEKTFTGSTFIKGKALKDLNLILPTSLPNIGPFDLSTTVADSKNGFHATELNGHIQESEFKGRLNLKLKGPRPRIEGVITSDRIVIPKFNGEKSNNQEDEVSSGSTDENPVLKKVESGVDFIMGETGFPSGDAGEKGEGEGSAKGGEQNESPRASTRNDKDRVVPDYEFPVEALNVVNLDVGFSIKDVEVPPHEIGDIDFRIKLENGELTVAPLRGTLWGGAVDGSLHLDAKREIPHIHVQTKIQDLDYGRLFKTTGVSEDVKGSADKIQVDLEGQGSTLREFLSQANGEVKMVDGKMVLKKKYLDLWASDLITGLLTSAWETKEETKLNCAVTNFEVENGMASSDEILFDTQRVTIAGVGTLDLGTEQVDVLLTPQPKDPTLMSLGHPVRISGPLAKPKVSGDKQDILKSAGWVALGIAVPVLLPLAVPQVAGTSLGSGGNPCEAALAGQPIKPVKSRERSFWDRITGFWKGSEESEKESKQVTNERKN